MPDGTVRYVKFDGVDRHAMIERKLSVYRNQKAKDQILRQDQVLRQHNLRGIWEVPTLAQRRQAIRLINRLGVLTIEVRVVKP